MAGEAPAEPLLQSIQPALVQEMPARQHSGSGVDRSVHVGADDGRAVGRLTQFQGSLSWMECF